MHKLVTCCTDETNLTVHTMENIMGKIELAILSLVIVLATLGTLAMQLN